MVKLFFEVPVFMALLSVRKRIGAIGYTLGSLPVINVRCRDHREPVAAYSSITLSDNAVVIDISGEQESLCGY